MWYFSFTVLLLGAHSQMTDINNTSQLAGSHDVAANVYLVSKVGFDSVLQNNNRPLKWDCETKSVCVCVCVRCMLWINPTC